MGEKEAELLCQLRREVPERSLERIITIAEQMGFIEPGILRRSTLHRILKAHGLSARKARTPDVQDLDRFEADAPNDLWQSDMLVGPYLPDPSQNGKMRRVYLYAFIDDHSRNLLHGRFSFKGDLPALELVFRRCLQKYGRPKRVYYDNGQTYRSIHMRQIVAALGIHRIIHTRPYRPQGHGKIEALNGLIRSAFLAELKVSALSSLDQLNEAFCAWTDLEYNQRRHGETKERPYDRWRAGLNTVQYVDEEKIWQAFLWREERTPDKTGIFSLFGHRYQVGPALARRRIEVRYDPEALESVEVWLANRFEQRSIPFAVSSHRRPKPLNAVPPQPSGATPRADWLSHLVRTRKEQRADSSPQSSLPNNNDYRAAADQEIIELLTERLAPAVIDLPAIRDYLARFGPFDPEQAGLVLDDILGHGERNDHHVDFYLNKIRDRTRR